MVELMRRLDRREFEVHIACFHRGGPLESRALEGAASIACFPIRRLRPSVRRAADAGVRALVPSHRRADRPHLRALREHPRAARRRARRRAACASATGASCGRPTSGAPTSRRSGGRIAAAHAVVANSTAAAEQLRSEGIPAATHPCHPERRRTATASPARPRHASDPPDRHRRQPAAGEGSRHAASPPRRSLAGRHPDVEVVIVGDGPLRSTLVRQVNLRGLRSRVRFLGERDDMPALLAGADLFVLPSRSEACPNARARGDGVGPADRGDARRRRAGADRGRHDGLLVPADDPNELARRDRVARSSSRHVPTALGRAARAEGGAALRLRPHGRRLRAPVSLGAGRSGPSAPCPASRPRNHRNLDEGNRPTVMCGFAGKLAPSPHAPIDRAAAHRHGRRRRAPRSRRRRLLRRRRGSGSAHRRLSIVDVAAGQQPLVERGRHRLGGLQRRDLQLRRPARRARGSRPPLPHPLRHRSDRPRLRAVGRACVERFRGMFAFALWDAPAAPAAARPRSRRHQAALLRPAAGRRSGVRLGDQVAARGSCRATRVVARGASMRT